jgi:co-chaperonin GroES (HSP10)
MAKVTKPLGSRVLVKEEVTQMSIVERGKLSGLTIVTDASSEPPPTAGTVLAIGSDPFIEEQDVHVGSLITFGPRSGTYITIEGTTYRSLDLSEILTVTNEEADSDQVDGNDARDVSGPRNDVGEAGSAVAPSVESSSYPEGAYQTWPAGHPIPNSPCGKLNCNTCYPLSGGEPRAATDWFPYAVGTKEPTGLAESTGSIGAIGGEGTSGVHVEPTDGAVVQAPECFDDDYPF